MLDGGELDTITSTSAVVPTAQDAQQQKCSAVHLLGVYTCTWVGANPFKGSATTSAAKPLLLLLL